MDKFMKLCGVIMVSCVLLTLMSARKRAADLEESKEAVLARTVLFDMNSTNGWKISKDKGTDALLNTMQFRDGRALRLTYNMKSGTWLDVNIKVPIDLSSYSGIRFKCRAEGAQNTVEVRLEDNHAAVYGTKIGVNTGTNEWTEVDVPFESLDYLWGGDEQLNLKKIMLHIAVSRQGDEDEGGSGILSICRIELNKR